MYDTALNWRANHFRFVVEARFSITNLNWFYLVDDKTGDKIFLGSDSGDTAISESRARLGYEDEKNKVLNAFKNELNMIVLPS